MKLAEIVTDAHQKIRAIRDGHEDPHGFQKDVFKLGMNLRISIDSQILIIIVTNITKAFPNANEVIYIKKTIQK